MMEKKIRKYINRRLFLYPKTNEIIEIREELYSIMLDKYNDYINFGMSRNESYTKAIEMMTDYKEAIKEVETGSSLSALKRNIISTIFFSSFYFIMLTLIYLFVSMVILKTFDKTWLIAVGGAFVYLTYVSVNIYGYAKLFNFKTLARWSVGGIYFSLVPILYVFPSLYLYVVHSKNIWRYSWLIVIIIALFCIMTDYIVNRKRISVLERDIHLILSGLILTTILYLSLSMRFQLWGVAWILYVMYLAVVSLGFYIGGKKGRFKN